MDDQHESRSPADRNEHSDAEDIKVTISGLRSGVKRMALASPAVAVPYGAMKLGEKAGEVKDAISRRIRAGADLVGSKVRGALSSAAPAPPTLSKGGGRDIELPAEKPKTLAAPRAMRGGRR
jgi:hypothetical protein